MAKSSRRTSERTNAFGRVIIVVEEGDEEEEEGRGGETTGSAEETDKRGGMVAEDISITCFLVLLPLLFRFGFFGGFFLKKKNRFKNKKKEKVRFLVSQTKNMQESTKGGGLRMNEIIYSYK